MQRPPNVTRLRGRDTSIRLRKDARAAAALPRAGGRLHHQLIDKTPAPVLARLEAAGDRMMDFPEVLGGVLVERVVAAADMTARQAETRVHPVAPHRQAFL